jgi:hypothetical protein
MGGYWSLALKIARLSLINGVMTSGALVSLALAGLALSGCSSDPSAPVNQSFPIRQMDNFFNSMSGPPARQTFSDQPDYTHHPGYAPAYPPY